MFYCNEPSNSNWNIKEKTSIYVKFNAIFHFIEIFQKDLKLQYFIAMSHFTL